MTDSDTNTTADNETDNKHLIHGANSMLGDLMSCVLDLAKGLPKPWQQLNQAEQEMWLTKVDMRIQEAIDRCVHIIASRTESPIVATVDSVTFKNGVKIALKMDQATEGAHDIADSNGKSVLVTVTDTEGLKTDHHKPSAEPDQASIPLKTKDK